MDVIDGRQDDRGELVESGERPLLRFHRRMPAPPAQVWAAITEPDQMAKWSFGGELEPRAGGVVRFDFGESGSVQGTVLTWVTHSVLEYEWPMGPDQPWRVRFELAGTDDDATRLTFDHLRPDPANADIAAGWHWHLDRLGSLLAGVQPAAVDSDGHFEVLQAIYRAERASSA